VTASEIRGMLSRQLSGSWAYLPLRTVYRIVRKPSYLRFRRTMRNFYRQFVGPGDLVFDVGANIGEYTEAFINLGARVVAVEPNPACCQRIRYMSRRNRLTVRCEAVGERQGQCVLHLGNNSADSSISEEWMEKASQKLPSVKFSGAITTNINTLDQIQHEYGTPRFIKIDVEGYEVKVLRGMSFRPRAISFEFHAITPDLTKECLQLPVFDSGCTFNVTFGESWEFIWPEWCEKDAVLQYVSGLPSEDRTGDIYVRFKD